MDNDLSIWEARCIDYWREHPNSDPAHDPGHVGRVWSNAQKLLKHEKRDCDILVLLLASYLHDAICYPKNDKKRSLAARESAVEALRVTQHWGLDKLRAEKVVQAIKTHSFSAGLRPNSVEGELLQDADRLEALGAIGVARCFATAGSMGSGLWDFFDPFAHDGRLLDDSRYAVDHFYVKLLKLPETFLTEAGREEAYHRRKYLLDFLATLADELGTTSR